MVETYHRPRATMEGVQGGGQHNREGQPWYDFAVSTSILAGRPSAWEHVPLEGETQLMYNISEMDWFEDCHSAGATTTEAKAVVRTRCHHCHRRYFRVCQCVIVAAPGLEGRLPYADTLPLRKVTQGVVSYGTSAGSATPGGPGPQTGTGAGTAGPDTPPTPILGMDRDPGGEVMGMVHTSLGGLGAGASSQGQGLPKGPGRGQGRPSGTSHPP